MSNEVPAPPHAEWLALPQITRAIETMLVRIGVRHADLEDHRQMVLERALSVDDPPNNLGECIGLVQKIARDAATDARRKARRRARFDDGPCDDADARPAPGDPRHEQPDRIDTYRKIEVVLRDIEGGRISGRQARILASAADQVSRAEIALEMELAEQTVANELLAARRTLRASWAVYAAAAVAAFALLAWCVRDRERIAAWFRHETTHGHENPARRAPGAARALAARAGGASAPARVPRLPARRMGGVPRWPRRSARPRPRGRRDPRRADCARHGRRDAAPVAAAARSGEGARRALSSSVEARAAMTSSCGKGA